MPQKENLASNGLVELLSAHPGWVGTAVLVIAFVESFAIAGVVVPGVALLAITAFAAGSGALGLGATLAFAFAGAVLGDGSSFLIGRRFGQALRARSFLARRDWIERGERFFAIHGVAGIVLGRFVGPVRPVMPLIAGMLGMRATLFFSVNLASALFWAPAYILPGYLVGASLVHALTLPPAWPLGAGIGLVLLWTGLRLTFAAWRSGERGGRICALLAGAGAIGALLRQPLGHSAGRDTLASPLAAVLTLILFLAALAGLLALPWLEPWRAFLLELARLAVRLA